MEKFDRRWRQLIHCLGLSCIGGAIFLQVLVFMDIIRQGYFLAVEKNPLILTFEALLTVFAFIYFIYIYQHLIRTLE